MKPPFKQWSRFLLVGVLTWLFCVVSHPAIAQLSTPSPTAAEQFQQGQQAYQQGQYAAAADLWQTVAERYAVAAEPLSQASALSNLGLTYLKLGHPHQAETAIAQAQALIDSAPDIQARQQVQAQVLSARAQYQQSQGQAVAALQSLSQAQAAYAAVEDTAGVVRSQLNQAQILRLQGQQRQSLTQLNQIAEQLVALPDSSLKAHGLRQLGRTLRFVEDAEQARETLEQALTVAQAINDPNEQSATLISLGNIAETQPSEDASIYYRQAIAVATDPILRAQAQVNHLRLLRSQGEQRQAQVQLADILDALDTLPPGRRSLFVRINLADILMGAPGLLDDRAIADLLAETLQQAETWQDTRSQAYAWGYLGKLYQNDQQWDAAVTLTRRALRLSQGIDADAVTYRWQWQLGQLLATQGETDAAIQTYQQTLQTLATLRSDLAAVNPEVRFSFREAVEPIYRELVALLLASDNPQETPQENLLQVRNVIESLQVAELVNFFRADCVVTNPVEIDQIDTSALVIYPIILSDRLEIVVSVPGQPLQHTTVPLPDHFNQTLDGLRQAISIPDEANRSRAARARLALERARGEFVYLPLAQRVYDWLIRPIEAQIQAADGEVLVFVLDGALRNIPMGVLHDGEQYLIEKHAIALTPGLQLIEPRPLAERQIQALVAGLSETPDTEFSALPYVEREVTAIQNQVSGEVLLNEEFSKANFSGKLTASPFPVVHLATHGKFSSDPEQTFVLAWDDRIRATELGALLQRGELSRETAIELLVLSACETAAGDDRAALGLAGVAVRSGARSTLATLWLVDDEGTSVLMESFYQKLTDARQSKAEVLRQAQLELLRNEDYKHPYFWAPFVLIGNWL